MVKVGLVLVLNLSLLLLLGVVSGQNYTSPDYVLNYSLDGVINVRLVPNGAINPEECLTGLCPNNFVSNVYLGELISDEPCSFAVNLQNRNMSSLFSINGSQLILSVPTLFNALFNSGDECILQLSCLINSTALLLSQYNTVNLTEIDINIIESDNPNVELNSLNCTSGEASYCSNYSKTVINYILPSFCNSSCIRPGPLTCYPFPPTYTDYILYRYELLKAAQNIMQLENQINQQRSNILACLTNNTGCPPGLNLNGLISAEQNFSGSCIASWQNATVGQ